MPLKGELQREIPFTIDCGGDAANASAITIVKINQRGGMHARTTTVAVGAAITINELLGPRIVRMILRAHPAAGGRMTLIISQGGVQFTDTLESDTDLVFDAVA